MAKRKYSEVEMIGALKQMEAGRTAAEVGREMGVSKHTVYAWKAKYGGMSVGEAQRLRQLEDENGRLKKLVADLSLDKDMLKAVIEKNGWSSWSAGSSALAVGKVPGEPAADLRADGVAESSYRTGAGGTMRRCASGWWNWRGRSRAADIGDCRCCWRARGAGEPQAGVSGVPGGGTDDPAESEKRLVREGSLRPAVTGANQEWALDFVHDAVESGRAFGC